MMHVYGTANTRSTRVLWTLEELGYEYDYTHVDLSKGDAEGRPFTQLNPAGKVPVLEHAGSRLTESAAICTYLADLDPERRLAPPPDTLARANFNQWCFFALSELEQPLWTLAKHRFIFPEELRTTAVRPAAEYEFAQMLDVLEKGLGTNSYILGDTLTVADLLIANTLGWARNYEIALPQTLHDYSSSLLARPALARARAHESLAIEVL